MNTSLKIKKIGNSAGIILPKEVLAHLNTEIGESLSLVTTPRGIELSAEEADFGTQMAAAREVMARRITIRSISTGIGSRTRPGIIRIRNPRQSTSAGASRSGKAWR